MRRGSRFMVCKHYHDERYANQTGMIIEVAEDGYHVNEVSFDNIMTQMVYDKEENVQFEMSDLLPSNQRGSRDINFERKLKEALVSLLERGELEISSSLNSDYDGKLIETKVFVDEKEVYSKEERV